MSETIQIAKKYFRLSNKKDLDAIAELFADSSTYSPENTGVYLGRAQIMDMMRVFYAGFREMHWDIHDAEEVRPGVVKFDFTFSGTKTNGEKVQLPGIEYVIVHNNKLQHVEVRNKKK